MQDHERIRYLLRSLDGIVCSTSNGLCFDCKSEGCRKPRPKEKMKKKAYSLSHTWRGINRSTFVFQRLCASSSFSKALIRSGNLPSCSSTIKPLRKTCCQLHLRCLHVFHHAYGMDVVMLRVCHSGSFSRGRAIIAASRIESKKLSLQNLREHISLRLTKQYTHQHSYLYNKFSCSHLGHIRHVSGLFVAALRTAIRLFAIAPNFLTIDVEPLFAINAPAANPLRVHELSAMPCIAF